MVQMQAELHVLSPLVAVREVSFLRFCKQHAEGVWAVVDVAVDGIRADVSSANCRRLPSGCLVQDMPDGYSKVLLSLSLAEQNLSYSITRKISFRSSSYYLGT